MTDQERLKIYLDGVHPPPPGWTLARQPDEVIKHLKTGKVHALSLNHDLGDDTRGTGYDVLVWLEEAVATRGFVPPRWLFTHTADPVAEQRMKAAARRIHELAKEE